MSNYSDSERRIDPEGKIDLACHAARALERFRNIQDPILQREAVQKAHFREGNSMRAVVLALLDRLEGKRIREQAELLKNLETQIESAVAVWTTKFSLEISSGLETKLIEGAKRWFSSLSGKILNGLLELCSEGVRFVVVPPARIQQLLSAIDSNKTISGQRDSKTWWNTGWDNVIASGWKFGITDARENPPLDPTLYYSNPDAPASVKCTRTNEQMVEESQQRFEQNGLMIMPQYGYVPTAATALAQGRPIDTETYTAFKRQAHLAFMPYARWDDDHMCLGYDHPGNSFMSLRTRPWVEWEMVD